MNFAIGSDGRGRKADACSTLDVGAMALDKEALVPPVLKLERWSENCHCCLQRIQGEGDGGRCSRCKIAVYCSKECQVTDFKRAHKRECRRIRSALEYSASNPTLRTEDMILLSRVIRGGEATMKAVESMENHPSDQKEASECARLAACTVQLFELTKYTAEDENQDEESTSRLVTRAARLAQRFKYNNFAIVDELYIVIAAGIFPTGAILNHSCQPNCVLSYRFDAKLGTTRQVIRVNRPVQLGEELTHAYCDTCWPRFKRQAYLDEVYRFRCQCQFCSNDSEQVREKEAELELLESSAKTEELRDSSDLNVIAEFKKLISSDSSHKTKPRYIPFYGRALEAALNERDWDHVRTTSAALADMYAQVYSEYHPLVGLQCFTFADSIEHVRLQQGLDASADSNLLLARKRAYKRALKILSCTSAEGTHHSLCLDLKQKIDSLPSTP